MPKIVLIEPSAPNLHIFSQFPLPRLGTLILGTMMERRGWEAEVYVEDFRKLDLGTLGQADLVGISTITSTARAPMPSPTRPAKWAGRSSWAGLT